VYIFFLNKLVYFTGINNSSAALQFLLLLERQMKTSFVSRAEVSEEIRAQKVRLGLKWAQVANELGRSKEWSVAACLGQMQMNEEEAEKVVSFEGQK
jgi:hypothetical protein